MFSTWVGNHHLDEHFQFSNEVGYEMTYYNSESRLLVLREEDFTNSQICAITGTTTPILK